MARTDPRRPQPLKEPEGGPGARTGFFVRSRYTPLETKRRRRRRERELGDALEENPDLILEAPRAGHWRENMLAYRDRQLRALRNLKRLEMPPAVPQPPEPPPAVNWIPIGPSVAMQGQAATRPAVSGRVARLAVSPGATRIYAAAAGGGVWRSDDAGVTWRSKMDAFDLDPTQAAAISLSCGAIAIDPADPDRVYVGTGEGDSAPFFAIGAALGVNVSYFGVGPVVSDDGGDSWRVEPIAAGDPSLNGQAFYQLAVDPNDREHVIAATTMGIYRRQFNTGLNGGLGGYEWAQVRVGNWTDVVVARPPGGPTTFVAARMGGGVFSSTNGTTWTALGTGFPAGGLGRISLAMQPDNTAVVYALIANAGIGMSLNSFQRYDAGTNRWTAIGGISTNVDPDGTNRVFAQQQANYDLAVVIDPSDVDTVYIGGSTTWLSSQWSGEIRHGTITSTGSGAGLTYSITDTNIGAGAHADIHHLVFTPGSSTDLWAGTDGGVFRATNAGTAATFVQRNVGLQTFTLNHIDLHPSEPAVAFAGAQDNGTLRYVGEECWLHSASGDGGFAVINWDDPYTVMRTFTRISTRRTTDGGAGYGSWTAVVPPGGGRGVFYGPIAGTPVSGTAADADVVAAGEGVVWYTTDFGTNWVALPSGAAAAQAADAVSGLCTALAFANANRLFVATTNGSVYRYDLAGGAWTRTRLDTIGGANALPLNGWITDIALDPADNDLNSIYITFGGNGDWRHVWHFDGAQWSARSGSASGAADALLDIHHNAIVVDPDNTNTLYAGADIGVWRSTDGGASWTVYSQGLPDAPVIDLQIEPNQRLLRAATHGRSAWERDLDAETKLGVELYVRDTELDLGMYQTVNGLDDPTAQGETVRHWRGPNIIVDTPSNAGGYQTPNTDIDFYVFNDGIVDGSGGVGTVDPATGTIINRVYVEVHNRGVIRANDVRVMLLLADASGGLPALPNGYQTNVQNGTPISTADWQTVGFVTLQDLRVGFPQVAYFPLPSTMLPPPSSLAGNTHHCLLALLHSPSDTWTATGTAVDPLSINDRKSAHKNLHVVEFTGTIPAGGGAGGVTPGRQFAALRLHGSKRTDIVTDLVLRTGAFPGEVSIVLPSNVKLESRRAIREAWEIVKTDEIADWSDETLRYLAGALKEGRFDRTWTKERIDAVRRSARQPELVPERRSERTQLPGIVIPKGRSVTVFVSFKRPRRASVGDCWDVGVDQVTRGRLVGGSTWRVQVVPKPDHRPEGLDLLTELKERRGRWWLEIRVLGARGRPLQSDRGLTVRALPLTGGLVGADTIAATFDRRLRAFKIPVDDIPVSEDGRLRLQVMVDRERRQVRRTLDIKL